MRLGWAISGTVALLALLAAACFERGGARGKAGAADDAGPRARARPSGELTDPTGPANPEATITIRLEAEPVHLNPFLTGDAIAARVALGDIYEGLLVTPRPGSEPALGLATSATYAAADRRWSFTIREGVSWHDGRPLSAADVVFTYELLGKGAPTWLAADFDDLRSVTAVGARVTMTFAEFRPGRRAAFARVPVLPRHLFRGDPARMLTAPANRRPVGTGPLRLQAWRGGTIELRRFDEYWGAKAGARTIIYRVIADRRQLYHGLAGGSIDLAVQLPVDEALAAAAAVGVRLFGYPRSAYLAAVYNLRGPTLEDARVRRALTMLLDRASIADKLFHGYAQVITGPFIPGSDAEDGEVGALAYDPAGAARLLGRAGAGELELEVLTPAGSRTMARIADIWAADAAPRVALRVVPLAYADLLARVREGRFEVAMMAFTTARDVDLYARFHSSSIGGENYGGVADPDLDRALDEARRESDPARRRPLQQSIHRRLHQLQPYTFILSDSRMGLVRRGIGGVAAGAGTSARGLWREQ